MLQTTCRHQHQRLLCSLLCLCLLLFQGCFAPGAHKFATGRNGRDLWGRCQPDGSCQGRNADESRLAAALFNGSVQDRERITNCMGHCYDADSNCPVCFAKCVDKCVPSAPSAINGRAP